MSEALSDCVLCPGIEVQRIPYDTVTWPVTQDIHLKPALGMMLPGNLLAVTKDHKTSFASLGTQKLSSFDNTLQRFESFLTEKFDTCFRLEHGSDNVTTNGSGACIEHAHTQLFCGGEEAWDHLGSQLPWQRLDTYEDLANFAGEPYIYLGRLGTHLIVPRPTIPSQWGRRMVAEVHSIEDWDWALRNDALDLMITFIGLRDLQPIIPKKST